MGEKDLELVQMAFNAWNLSLVLGSIHERYVLECDWSVVWRPDRMVAPSLFPVRLRGVSLR